MTTHVVTGWLALFLLIDNDHLIGASTGKAFKFPAIPPNGI